MIVILSIIVFGLVYWFLTRNIVNAPPPMTEEELLQEGLTKLEARRELRAQRGELRYDANTTAQALRTANQISRTVSRIAKKQRW